MSETNKNINYGNIHAGGNVHIGDVYLFHEGKAQPTLLFLRIEKSGDTHQASLFVKAGDSINIAPVLREPVTLNISQDLFQQASEFQNLFRSGGDQFRNAGRAQEGVQHREDLLAEALHRTFFASDIGDACAYFIDLLENRKIKELLLVVSSEEEAVRNLPWEMALAQLFAPKSLQARNHLMVNSFGFVRTTQASLQAFELSLDAKAASPLKLLFITALPENQTEGSKMLQIEHEQRKLIEAIGGLEATGDQRPKIVIEFLDNASLAEIDEALTARSHDILHISGHGAYVQEVNQGILHLENEDGDEQQVSGAELAAMLRRHTCLRLLLLSACETAVAGQGTAEALAAAGIPAVLAMRFAVTDRAATMFTSAFYEQLAKGATLNHALAHGREILWQDVQQRRQIPAQSQLAEWFTPVVYQNQYIGAFAQPQQYREDIFRNFYPKSNLVKTGHTKLIGEGFIGRKRYLIQLRQSFKQGQAVCLHGLGGLGKTTLAEAFADNYRKRFGHELLVFRGGLQISEAIMLERIFAQWQSSVQPDAFFAKELKDALDSPQLQPLQKLDLLIANCLANRKIMLIFDNFEDVQTGEAGSLSQAIGDENLSAFLLRLLQQAPPNCHLLFTTRYKITDFEGQLRHLPLDKMSYAEQWRHLNFSDTLRRIPMTEREAVHRRLDGHPRAFEFLEGLLRKDVNFDWGKLDASVGDVEARIFENLLLERIDAQLSAEQRHSFEAASVFFSRSPLAALAAATGEAEDTLREHLNALRDWSLCFFDEKAGTFEVHALTREWLRRQERLSEEARKALAHKAGAFFRDQPTWAAEELAIAYFELAEAWEDFAGASFRLQNHFQLCGFYQKAWALNQMVLEKGVEERSKALALFNCGAILKLFGQYKDALVFYEQSLEIYQKLGDRESEGRTLNNISQIYQARGEYHTALTYLQDSLKIAQEVSNRKEEGTTLNNISQIYQARGEYHTALIYLEDSLKISQEVSDRKVESATLNNMGQIYGVQGDYERSLQYLEDSLKISQEIGNRQGEGTTLNNLVTIAHAHGDYAMGLRYLGLSLKISQEIGDRQVEGATLNNIGQIYGAQGDYMAALRYLEDSLKIRQEIGDRSGEGMTLNNIGLIYDARGDYESALGYLEDSLKISQEIGDRRVEGATLNNISQIYDAQGDYKMALRYLEGSLKIRQEIGDISGKATTLANIGALLFKQGKLEEAVPLLVQAHGAFTQIGSPNAQKVEGWLNDVIEQIGEARFKELLEAL